jgi:hypothetical protein
VAGRDDGHQGDAPLRDASREVLIIKAAGADGSRQEGPLALGALGLVFAGAGLFVLWGAVSAPPDPALAAEVVDASRLGALRGKAVVLEGRVGAANPLLDQDFALLQRQVAKGVTRPGSNDVRFSWEVVAAEPDSFLLESGGSPITVSIDAAEWRDPPHTTDPGVVTAGAQRVTGFHLADVVTVLATVLFGGNAAALRASLTRSGLVEPILGGLFSLIGLSTLTWTLVQLVRSRR